MLVAGMWLWLRERVGCARAGVDARGPDAAAGHDEVVARAHALHGFNNVFLVVRDDLNPFQLHAEGEAELG